MPRTLRRPFAALPLALAAPVAAAGDRPDVALDLAVRSMRECPLPPSLQYRWERSEIGDVELAVEMLALRDMDPWTFAPTGPPPPSVRPVPDLARMDTLHLVFPPWPDHTETYAVLLREATREGRVHVQALDAEARARLGALLAREDLARDRLTVTEGRPETLWIRDYGPVPVEVGGAPGWVDFRYSADCIDNDAWPTRTAPASLDGRVWRAPLYLDGGNLAVDPAGRCYTTTAAAEDNRMDEPTLRAALITWLGCSEVAVLEPLQGAVIDHVDMLLAPASGDTLLLAAFDASEDPRNHAVMARNRQRLAALAGPPTLVAVPSPPPGEIDEEGALVRTWVNLLPFNGVVFVPTYADQGSGRWQAARARIAAAYPDRRVVPVPSDVIIRERGAVHCIGRATP